MNAWWQSPIVVLAVAAWLAAPPHSIGEASQREALRRQLTPKSRTFLTNAGQPSEIPVGAAVAEAPPTEPPAGAPPGAAPGAAPAKDEAWWRTRVNAANEMLKRDQDATDALQVRVNVLQRDAVNVDDPVRRTAVRDELKKTLEELDRSRKLIDDDRKAIVEIQDDARRQNVPPGWVR
jgi:hypothetical protein